MPDSTLLLDLIARAAHRTPDAPALTAGASTMSYASLQADVAGFAAGLCGLGLERGERVGIYLEKRCEGVIASFGAPAAGGVFVPLNPLLKPEQVAYILRDCNVRVLVTSPERLALLVGVLAECPDLRHVVVTDAANVSVAAVTPVSAQMRALPQVFDLIRILANQKRLEMRFERGDHGMGLKVIAG